MTDPRMILTQARQGPVPASWRVFTKKRGKVSGFLRGTSEDPDPLLVITPDGAIEYKDDRKPPAIVNFHDLAGMTLKATATTSSSSSFATLTVWVDLSYRDGTRAKWRSTSFADNLQTIQGIIEAYSAHQALQGRY